MTILRLSSVGPIAGSGKFATRTELRSSRARGVSKCFTIRGGSSYGQFSTEDLAGHETGRPPPPVARLSVQTQAAHGEAGFPVNDKLYQLTAKSYDALHHLCVEIHYLSCTSGVGRPDKA